MKKLEEIIKEKNEEILELEKKLIDINTKYDKLREESFSLSLTETTGQKILEKLNLLGNIFKAFKFKSTDFLIF